MNRIFCLVVIFVGFCIATFGQELAKEQAIGSEWEVIDTVRVSSRMYEISAYKDLYAYENIRDRLRFFSDNIDYRILGESAVPVNGDNVRDIIVNVLHAKINHKVCSSMSKSDFYLGFDLYADVEGNVKEVVCTFGKGLYPYFTAADFDKVVMRLLKQRIRVDSAHPALAKARWVRYYISIHREPWLRHLKKYE